jgi:CMP-N-acetylneuraminic acid synthetase
MFFNSHQEEDHIMQVIEKPLCIIPARGGSKRFPRKNIAPLLGKPLIAYAIETAKKSEVFDKIFVSSDDDEILEIAEEYGADIAQKRPADLASDAAQIKHVCVYILQQLLDRGYRYDMFGLILATNPFTKASDIKQAYEKLFRSDANAIMSVIPFNPPPQRAVWFPDGYIEPYFGMQYMKQAHLLESLFVCDGSIYFARTGVFLKEQDLYLSRMIPFRISSEISVDIDYPEDLMRAEYILKKTQNG